jgi:hypothetical protein
LWLHRNPAARQRHAIHPMRRLRRVSVAAGGTIRVKQEKKLRFLFNGKSLVVGSGVGTSETPKIY